MTSDSVKKAKKAGISLTVALTGKGHKIFWVALEISDWIYYCDFIVGWAVMDCRSILSPHKQQQQEEKKNNSSEFKTC